LLDEDEEDAADAVAAAAAAAAAAHGARASDGDKPFTCVSCHGNLVAAGGWEGCRVCGDLGSKCVR
jgi:hypothetical protein